MWGRWGLSACRAASGIGWQLVRHYRVPADANHTDQNNRYA